MSLSLINGQHPRDGARDWDLFGEMSQMDKARGDMSHHIHGRSPRVTLKKPILSSGSKDVGDDER